MAEKADQAITALPKKTYSGSSKIEATDYLLGIDSAEGYQMLIQDLGEYIINKVTTSLAGSNQTLVAAIGALNSNLSSLYCRNYSYASGTSYKDAVTDVISKLGNATARYWVIITIGTSRHSLMIIKDGTPWSNGILTSYASTGTEVYFVSSRSVGQSAETVVYLRKLLTGDLE